VLSSHQKLLGELPENVRQKFYVIDMEEMRWPTNEIPYQYSDAHPTEE
jgi:hypothetical protein